MRTTVTLTPEAESLIRRVMRERGLSFKDAVNAAIIGGLAPQAAPTAFATPTFDLGRAHVSLDRALARAADLEDEELLRKQSMGK
jgi:hypothetical protein